MTVFPRSKITIYKNIDPDLKRTYERKIVIRGKNKQNYSFY